MPTSNAMPDGCFPLGMGLLAATVGIGMRVWPGALADATVVGRYGLLKEGLIWLWAQGPAVAWGLAGVGVVAAAWGAWVLRRDALAAEAARDSGDA